MCTTARFRVGTGIRTHAAELREAVDDCVLGFHVDEPGIGDRRRVRRGGHREVSVLAPFMEIFLPGDLPDARVQVVRVVRRKSCEAPEDPVARPEVEVQPHRIGERPLRPTAASPRQQDNRGADLPASQGDLPAGDEDGLRLPGSSAPEY
jgi:hypothetical protein